MAKARVLVVDDSLTMRASTAGSGRLEIGRGIAVQPIKPTDIVTTVLDMCRG